MMNEADLKKTWCPYARVPLPVVQHVRGMAGSPVETVSVNREADGSIPAAARCIGSACSQFRRVKHMQWVRQDGKPEGDGWEPRPDGMWFRQTYTGDVYCGRAGEP